MLGFKKGFDYVSNQYAVRGNQIKSSEMRDTLIGLKNVQEKEKKNPYVFINYLDIKPMKITLSVFLDHDAHEDIHLNLIGILRYIPFGI